MKNLQRLLNLIFTAPTWLLAARLVFVSGFVAGLVYEWRHWPNGSAWFGPFGLVWYGGLDAGILLLCSVSLTLVFAWAIRPGLATAILTLIGLVNWLFWGVLAEGIGC